ncbi:hypothetical protein AS96_15115 [Microbacterium sp. MRS-1]|nr:hypothetical protein AS96_15115 [Microbacterium sp. MRS-1]
MVDLQTASVLTELALEQRVGLAFVSRNPEREPRGFLDFFGPDLVVRRAVLKLLMTLNDEVVLPREVGQSADGWVAADRGVGPVVIVGVQPGRERVAAG